MLFFLPISAITHNEESTSIRSQKYIRVHIYQLKSKCPNQYQHR